MEAKNNGIKTAKAAAKVEDAPSQGTPSVVSDSEDGGSPALALIKVFGLIKYRVQEFGFRALGTGRRVLLKVSANSLEELGVGLFRVAGGRRGFGFVVARRCSSLVETLVQHQGDPFK